MIITKQDERYAQYEYEDWERDNDGSQLGSGTGMRKLVERRMEYEDKDWKRDIDRMDRD